MNSDIIIIGGGIAGISLAARLAPHADVTVLEAESALGYHATGRSAAMFILNYGNATLRALNAVAQPFFETPPEGFGGTLLSPRGELMIATAQDIAALESQMETAPSMTRLTPAQAGELVPILNTDRLIAAAYDDSAFDIDVDRLLQGFARQATGNGARIIRDARVTGLTRSGGLWQVQAGGKRFDAPVVVNAAGAWADQIAALAGAAPVGLRPLRRSAALIPAPAGFDPRHWPVFVSATEDFYAKPEAGKLMVSPADEDPVEPGDAWPDDMVLAQGLARFEAAVTTPVIRVERSWAGLRTFAPDRTPVAGFDPQVEGFFWLAGQGGYGVQTAPALSALGASLITRTPPEIPAAVVAALSPERFA